MIALVVDDSAAMRRMQQKALESLGFVVQVAKDGHEAMSVLQAMAACDLVLTDWHMPELDGLGLVREIRKQARYAKLRVIMVTSDAVLGSVQLALDAGVDDFLMKPFSPDALAERIQDVMHG
jgi:two-component system, chemotaxis family, chemotaxis protein CheY